MTYRRIDAYGGFDERVFNGDRCQDGGKRCPFSSWTGQKFFSHRQEFWCTRFRTTLDYEGHAEVPLRCVACQAER